MSIRALQVSARIDLTHHRSMQSELDVTLMLANGDQVVAAKDLCEITGFPVLTRSAINTYMNSHET